MARSSFSAARTVAERIDPGKSFPEVSPTCCVEFSIDHAYPYRNRPHLPKTGLESPKRHGEGRMGISERRLRT